MNPTQPSLSTYERIADRARLLRQSDARPIVVCEGPADERFLHRIFGGGRLIGIPAGSRSIVLSTALDLQATNLKRVVCLVDRDFDDTVAEHAVGTSSLCVYDQADLEGMLWFTPALDNCVMELASTEKLSAFGGVTKLRNEAHRTMLPVQRLRRANALYGWGIKFDAVDFTKRIERKTLTLNISAFCDSIRPPDGPSKRDLVAAATDFELPECQATGRGLARGGDLLSFLAVALRSAVGSQNSKACTEDQMANHLRLSASADLLRSTPWYTDISKALSL